jgi:acyl-CoA synthetase (NDP forming)
MTSLADALFRPRAVALVGASGDEGKNTARPQRFLTKHGFTGRVVPINRTRNEVLGVPAWPDLAAATGPIDHAFVMVPAAAVSAVIEDCGRAGVPVATIYSDGFADAGADGLARQDALVALAREHGVRLIGPNSMGVIDTHVGAAITVNAALEADNLSKGSIGVVSQSGTVLGTLLSRGQARGIGFSKLVSMGNECDIGVGEVVDMMVDDPETEAILLFLETIRDPELLGPAARRAFAAGKPVIAYKLGRSDIGRDLAVSHSGAIAGPDDAATAYFRHHGILRVDMLETMFELPALVAGRSPPSGRRVAVVTTTGGGAAMVADNLGRRGVELMPAPDKVKSHLAPLGIDVGKAPVIDLTMAGTRKEVYGAALNLLLDDPGCDAVVAVVGSSAQFHPEVAVEPLLGAGKRKTPLAAFLVPQADRSLGLLAEAGVPAFRTPESCADGLAAFLDWSTPVVHAPPARDLHLVHGALAAPDGKVFDELESGAVFAALGISQATTQVVEGDGEMSSVTFPVAAKVLSRDLPHKMAAGGVVLDIADAAALTEAIRAIRDRTGLADTSVLVQHMERGILEALVGYRDNPETGPVVIVGLGGALAEVYGEVAIRLAPVDVPAARQMIAEVPGLATLLSRGGDAAALAEAVAAVSDLARIDEPRIAEAEINPLIVKADGAVAVDGLVVLSPPR